MDEPPQKSQETIESIDYSLDNTTTTGDNEAGDNGAQRYSESNLDLFSHDSTHVRLVIEAERQSSLAREKAAALLMNLSMKVEVGGAAKDETTTKKVVEDTSTSNVDETDEVDAVDEKEPKEEQRDDNGIDDVDNVESNLDNLRIDADPDIDESSNPSKNEANNKNDVFELMAAPSEDDIEHLKQCIMPLSPSGVRKSSKPISGQFEFKRLNSVLTVVKSFDDDSKKSFGSSTATSKKSKSSKSSKFSWRSKKSKHSNRSNANSFTDSNALTDEAFMMEVYEEELRNLRKKKIKVRKAGDLPPRSNRRPIPFGGSVGGNASEPDREDVISVVSNMSELSLESISHRMVRDISPLVVVTDESQVQTRIPETICLKSQVKLSKGKLSKLGKLKRKLSFGRSSKASF